MTSRVLKYLKSKISIILLTVMVGVSATQSADAALITSGYNPALLSDDTVGVRYRGQSTGDEHYVGINNLGEAANRNDSGLNWVNGVIPFQFSFNSLTGEIVSTLDGKSLNFFTSEGLFSNVLQLTLSNRSKNDGTFEISDLFVNGETLGGLSCEAFCDWMVTDYNVLPLLTVTGNIIFSGTMDSNDSERVKFQIRSNAVAPVSVPELLSLFVLSFLGVFIVRRRRSS